MHKGHRQSIKNINKPRTYNKKNKLKSKKGNNKVSKTNENTKGKALDSKNIPKIENKSTSNDSSSFVKSKRDLLSNGSLKSEKPQAKSIKPKESRKDSMNPLEAMMDKFHESLPHLNSLEESRFSDDSLEDEDSSTVITSKPSTIDHKSLWTESADSQYSANDSSASFDYFKATQKTQQTQ